MTRDWCVTVDRRHAAGRGDDEVGQSTSLLHWSRGYLVHVRQPERLKRTDDVLGGARLCTPARDNLPLFNPYDLQLHRKILALPLFNPYDFQLHHKILATHLKHPR